MPSAVRCAPFSIKRRQSRNFKKIHVLLRLERMLHEERNDAFEQMLLRANAIRHAVPMIYADNAASEMRFQRMEDLNVAFMLDHSEFGKNLETGGHLDVRIDANMKASFSVDKSDDPLCFEIHEMSPKHEVSEGFRFFSLRGAFADLSCGLSPCPPDFYGRSVRRLVLDGCGGVSRIWFGFTKASEFERD